MRISWKIEKKRGNLRPLLSYNVTLEEHEKALALPPIRIVSSIPKPDEHWQEFCYPNTYERRETQKHAGFHELEVPSHKGHSWAQTLRLPWRSSNEYPEIDASFSQLRDAFELELKSAYASTPLELENSLETSDGAKEEIAPGVLAERFLALARKSAQGKV